MNSDPVDFEVVVGPDGGIAPNELARYGVRPGAHLRLVSESAKTPPFRSAAGILTGAKSLSWDDFVAGSELAAADAEAGPTFPSS
jgi:hypothetical protein